PKGISFTNVTPTDTLVIKGPLTGTPTSPDLITLATGKVTVDGSVILFKGVSQLEIDALSGANTVTETGTNLGTVIKLVGLVGASDKFSFNLPGDFNDNLTVQHFSDVRGHAGGNFSGHWTVQGSGTIDDLTVGGDLTGMVMTGDITQLMVMGTVSGVVAGSGSGTLTTGDVGSVSDTGVLMFEDVTNLTVMTNMSGTINGTQAPGEPPAGNLGMLTVGGSPEGPTSATNSDTISAGAASPASPVVKITEGGVLRELLATRAD